MERPFDYSSSPAYEVLTVASCAAKVRACIAYIRTHKPTGKDLVIWQGYVRDWRNNQRYYRKVGRH